MTTKERSLGITTIAVGLGAVAFAILSGLTTGDGGPDWVGIVTVGAGLALIVTGLFNLFHHDTA
ncbi:MAG TPA: hypothetical protein VGQ50_14320 [Actinomycetota bacterium]|jgi:hypothetical protein|nr:hypothetical protein [Actinomycetota bacterium]